MSRYRETCFLPNSLAQYSSQHWDPLPAFPKRRLLKCLPHVYCMLEGHVNASVCFRRAPFIPIRPSMKVLQLPCGEPPFQQNDEIENFAYMGPFRFLFSLHSPIFSFVSLARPPAVTHIRMGFDFLSSPTQVIQPSPPLFPLCDPTLGAKTPGFRSSVLPVEPLTFLLSRWVDNSWLHSYQMLTSGIA